MSGSQTEYNTLTKVALGRLDPGNTFPTDDLGMLLVIAAEEKLYDAQGELDIDAARSIIPDITEEIQETTEKELDRLRELYESKGIEVVRPEPVPPNQSIVTPDFETTQFPVYCPRDILFNFRDLIIVSPNLYRSRTAEAAYYEHILNQEREQGRVVVFAPRPRLRESDFNFNADAEYILDTNDAVFEAANVLIDGEHNAIYYQVSQSGNMEGCMWLQSVISKMYPEITVYPMHVYKGTHFDTTIAILNYDTVALNPERITDVSVLPEPLQNRKHIFPDIIDTTNDNGLSSKWIGMNTLSLSPTEIVVDSDQTHFIEQLEHNGFTVYPHKLTYCDVIEGGHHCTSSDLQRQERY